MSCALEGHQPVKERLVVAQFDGGSGMPDRALLEDVNAIGERQREFDACMPATCWPSCPTRRLEAALVLAKAQLGFAQLLPRSATSGHARDLDRVTGFDPKTPSPARGRMVGFAPPVATFPSSWACKPSSHSMTLSACTSNDGGTVRPSFLAVFMLITSSNLVGSSIGRLPGFAPFNMRST
jgi:hypothetical protein